MLGTSWLPAALAQERTAARASEVEPGRRALLEKHLERAGAMGWAAPYVPAVAGTLGIGAAAAMALTEVDEHKDERWYVIGGVAAFGIASFGSYFFPWTRGVSLVLEPKSGAG